MKKNRGVTESTGKIQELLNVSVIVLFGTFGVFWSLLSVYRSLLSRIV